MVCFCLYWLEAIQAEMVTVGAIPFLLSIIHIPNPLSFTTRINSGISHAVKALTNLIEIGRFDLLVVESGATDFLSNNGLDIVIGTIGKIHLYIASELIDSTEYYIALDILDCITMITDIIKENGISIRHLIRNSSM
jgi:hypothetical protein